jgi:hypothetical protein
MSSLTSFVIGILAFAPGIAAAPHPILATEACIEIVSGDDKTEDDTVDVEK